MSTTPGILATIGATPVVELRRVVPPGCARVLVKLEGQNPTGSMKDRMARAVVEGALASGKLRPGGTVVEYTGGSTGTSLAFVCAALGYPITLVSSDAFSREKRDHMRALGATVIELPSDGGRTTKALIQRMIAKAAELAAAPGAFYADQFNNPRRGGRLCAARRRAVGAGGRTARRIRAIRWYRAVHHRCRKHTARA